jgi:hypothetical protein
MPAKNYSRYKFKYFIAADFGYDAPRPLLRSMSQKYTC